MAQWSPFALSAVHSLPGSLSQELISESLATAFAPAKFEISDFEVEWKGQALDGVRFGLIRQSLEWVRVSEVLVLPRGRLLIQAKGIESGVAKSGGQVEVFEILPQRKMGKVSLPVPLMSGQVNIVDVQIKKNGQDYQGQLMVRFKNPKHKVRNRVLFDHQCSGFNVQAGQVQLDQKSWVFVGCRMIRLKKNGRTAAALELYVYWDNIDEDQVFIDGFAQPADRDRVWRIRVRDKPQKVQLQSGRGKFDLTYFVPDPLHNAFIGIGLGPYKYDVNGNNDVIDTYAPVITLYGSYFIDETLRAVLFNASSINGTFFTDTGVYLLIEQFRVVDKRISINLLLGAHALYWKYEGETHYAWSAPQGFEVIYRDFISRRKNLGMGAFVRPNFDGRSYINTWVRWGSGSFFWELNYIDWSEPLGDFSNRYRAAGLTVGFPLARFL